MWIIEEIKTKSYKAKYGESLKSTARFDDFEFACCIEDAGDGIALITNAVGSTLPIRKLNELGNRLQEMGFTEVRWTKIKRRKLA